MRSAMIPVPLDIGLPESARPGIIRPIFHAVACMTDTTRCSLQSLLAQEPMAGSADNVDVWLLLEYTGSWRSQALADNELSAEEREAFEQLAQPWRRTGRKVRLQFIRQQRRGDRYLFTIVDGVTRLRRAASVPALAGAVDEPVSLPHYFVCTHGQRDLCCAEFGMPLYRALRERVGERVWQTTHLGGHRFAPNVLVAPGAVMYGRVTPASFDAWFQVTESGGLYTPCARGRTCYPAPAQAAEILGGARATLRSVRSQGNGDWRVEFDDRVVSVHEAVTMSQASCGDTRLKASSRFELGAGDFIQGE
ncbi:MAG: hypothetical protein H6994_10880 [Pseudomonadales bacterium]|nr:hypothetical protein [Pseudomonadales bacterium]